MKRLIAAILSVVLCLALLAGCGGTNPSPSPSATAAATAEPTGAPETGSPDTERTRFVLGFDASFPPYGFVDDKGEYVGFDLDLAAEVCERRGWELVFQPIDWDAKFIELDSGTIDCIWNGFTMNGREDLCTWTAPYADNSQVFVVAADSGIATKADLAGKTVGVQAESSADTALNDEEVPENIELMESFAELVRVPDYNTAFMNLESGAVDAVAMDIGVAKYQMAQRTAGEFEILEEALAAEQYGVGFKVGNTELRDMVQETLLEMVEDGTVAEIVEKWDADYGIADSIVLGKED